MTGAAAVLRLHLQALEPGDPMEGIDMLDDEDAMREDLIEAMDDKRLIDPEFDGDEFVLELAGYGEDDRG